MHINTWVLAEEIEKYIRDNVDNMDKMTQHELTDAIDDILLEYLGG